MRALPMTGEEAFKLLEDAAVKGERCPQTRPHGPLPQKWIGILARAGRIRSEVFQHNYRVVTILEGPNAGKSTKPSGSSKRPYMVTTRDGTFINGKQQDFALSSGKRIGPSSPRDYSRGT